MSRIGLAIAMGSEATYHTQTFIDAMNYSKAHFPSFRENDIRIVNDHKSREGGLAAAQELTDWGADVVVGHYSSISATSSLPIYAAGKIPVILPASTSCELLSQAKRSGCTIFRYQRDNAQLMNFCFDDCGAGLQNSNGYVIVQDNFYGNTLLKHIPEPSQVAVMRDVPPQADRNGTYIVLGYSDYAARVIRQLTHSQVHRIVVMDDSDADESYDACIIRPNRFSRICSALHLIRHGQARAFWNETLLGLSLAVSLTESPGTGERWHRTYLGLQQFDFYRCYEASVLMSVDIDN